MKRYVIQTFFFGHIFCSIFCFEQLSSSIVWQAMELQSGAKIRAQCGLNMGFQSTNTSYTGDKHVNTFGTGV